MSTKEYHKEYQMKNRERIREQRRQYYERNREKIMKASSQHYENNKEKILAEQRTDRLENPEKHKELDREKYKKNREKILKRVRERYSKKKKEIFAYHNEYKKNRKKVDPNFKLAIALRCRLNQALKGRTKKGSHVKLLGCSLEDFRAYLESKFEEGMSWDNYGFGENKWTLDHIRPLSWFNLEDVKQLSVACHYTNIQPMWLLDNISKGARFAG